MSITTEEIKHIAHLAKLEFSDIELEKFSREFNNILEYVSKIKECDTTGIEFEHNLSNYKGTILQDDVAVASTSREKLLMNATDGRNARGYVKTSKIVSKAA